MNFLGHTHVARATGGDDPRFLLGAVLPDLASMAGVRVDRAALPAGPLADGIRCHLDVDAAFHALPAFREGMAGIRAALAPHELGRGATRAIGHIGWELLLDGTLLGTSTEAAFWRAMDVAHRHVDAVPAADRDRWSRFLDRWFTTPRPRLRYDDPEWVAERLYLMLSHRPHLRFPLAHVPAVAVALADRHDAVRAAGAAVLADLADLTGSGRGP
ncbi:MAG TPA: hypothetical protein VIL36_20630 [Acidimicrobiales bacterium]